MSELGPSFPQPHEPSLDDAGIPPWAGQPSMYGPKGRHTRHLDAAIKVALREYETSRGRVVDFTNEHIRNFAETVLARWSEAIVTSEGMGS